MTAQRSARPLAAVTLVAGLTLLARLVGFGRVFVFNGTVGAGCTGAAYAAANQLPNVLFEVVAGGALAGAVVPLLAGQHAAGRDEDADRTASALLTWVVAVLLPLSLLLALAAGPLSRALLAGSTTAGECGDAAAVVALTGRFVAAFAPQVLLYGVGTVLVGVLQARHRFTGAALAPLLSSLVVIAAYLLFGAVGGGPAGDPARLPGRGAELVLSIGTTLGVVALSLPLLVPARRAGIRLRPTRRFPAGSLRALRGPALAGAAALLAQQLSVAVTVVLTSRVGGAGALNAVQYVQAVYLLPYAVLAVPVATTTYPRLAAHAAAGRAGPLTAAVAGGIRSMIVLGLLGTGILVAAAPAVQALLQGLDAAGGGALGSLAESLTWFALGLPGWALVAQLTRTLYALGRARAAAIAPAAGWLLAAVGSVALALGLRGLGVPGLRATLLATGAATSAGMLLAAGLLLPAVRRAAGPAALAGTARIALAAGSGGALAAAVGRLVAEALTPPGRPATALAAVVSGVLATAVAVVVAAAVFGLVRWMLEPSPAGTGTPDPRVLLLRATSDGGTGRHVAAVARWLHARGVPVRLAVPDAMGADPVSADPVGAGVPVPVVTVDVTDRLRPLADLRALRRLRDLAGEVDVIHAHGLRAGALAVLAARSRRWRPAVVVTVHNAPVPPGHGRRVAAVQGLLARLVARGADRVLVVSGDLGDLMRSLGARQVARALVPAPPRAAGSAPPGAVRAALDLGPGAWLTVTVARLAPQKGLDGLLDALARLRGTRVRAVVAGTGPLERHLAERVTREVLPVTLLGHRDDVADLLAAADVVVVPSVWEGQPLIVQEALRAGAAIVATDAGGTREVAGDAAVLVPPGDPARLAEALSTLLDNPRQVITLRQQAVERAGQLPTDDDAGWQLLGIYRELGETRRRAATHPFQPGDGDGAGRLEARGAADS